MKLATIVKVLDVSPIEGADRIEVASVLGYKVVAAKGVYRVGDLAAYIVPDTLVPKKPWSEFLFKGGDAEKEVARLRVARLRGQVSQGLLIPISELNIKNPSEGLDVTEALGVKKYSKPVPVSLGGEVWGYMPGFLHKTDEDNLRSNPACIKELLAQQCYCYISQKIDGSSATFFLKDGEFGVCSRNMHLKKGGNVFWRIAEEYDIESRMRNLFGGQNVAIQGEVYGEGINKNHLGIRGQKFQMFDLWYIDGYRYGDYDELDRASVGLQIPKVDTVWMGFFNFTLDDLIEMSNGSTYPNGSPAEGIVIRPVKNFYSPTLGGRLSVKVISEKFCLKHGE